MAEHDKPARDNDIAPATPQDNASGAGPEPSADHGSGRLSEAYERIVARFNNRSDSLSREGMQEELDEALSFEAEVEEFTRDELAILRAWVERDISEFRRYLVGGGESLAGFLGIDLSMLSDRLRQGLCRWPIALRWINGVLKRSLR